MTLKINYIYNGFLLNPYKKSIGRRNDYINSGLLLQPYKSKVAPFHLVGSMGPVIGVRNDYLMSGLLLPYKKSFGYSPSLTSLISLRSFSSAPSYSCSKFRFKSLPRYHYHLVVTGKEVVKFVTIRDIFEMALGPLVVDKSKIRLVFGVVDVIPRDTLIERRNQGKYLGFTESFSQLKNTFKQMFSGISYEEEGIEFTFGFEAVDLLFKMINHVIESQGKDPEMIHIWMSFWLAEDDGHDMSRYETRN